MFTRIYIFLFLVIVQMGLFKTHVFAASSNAGDLRESELVSVTQDSKSTSDSDLGASVEGRGVEWRILGPAFSKHSNTNDAPVVGLSKIITDCGFTGQDYCRDVLVLGAKKWSQNNPAIGLEWSKPSSEGSTGRDRIFGSLVRDSFGRLGLMGGVGRTWEIAQLGSFNVQAGVGGGLWLRSVLTDRYKNAVFIRCDRTNDFGSIICPGDSIQIGQYSYRGLSSPKYRVDEVLIADPQYRLIPFVLPLVSVTESRTKLGVNISVVPPIRFGKYRASTTTTALFQLSYLF